MKLNTLLVAVLCVLQFGCGESPRESVAPDTAIAGAIPAASAFPKNRRADGPPNVVLMVADDLGYGDLSSYGAKHLATPNIDALAVEGFRATSAYATASVCTPSRYSLLTGSYYVRYRFNWLGEQIPNHNRDRTIAQALKQRGYPTGYFGKWHLGWGERDESRALRADIDWNHELPAGVLEAGFDAFFGTPFSHNVAPWVFVRDRHVIGVDVTDPIDVSPLKSGGDYSYLGGSVGGRKEHESRPVAEIDRRVTDEALAWIGMHTDVPFFVQINFVAPHVPIVPEPVFSGSSGIGAYGDVIQQLDHHVGRVLVALKESGLNENTFIIFTSDNGGFLDPEAMANGHQQNGPLLGQKTDLWEGGVKVPFIAVLPGSIPAGGESDELISLSDVPNTILDAIGAGPEAFIGEDGLSQLGVLRGETPSPRRDLVMIGTDGRGLRMDNWVYLPMQGSGGMTTKDNSGFVSFAEMGKPNSDISLNGTVRSGTPSAQLYDVAADPFQEISLASERIDVMSRVQQRFHAYEAHFRDRKPGYPSTN